MDSPHSTVAASAVPPATPQPSQDTAAEPGTFELRVYLRVIGRDPRDTAGEVIVPDLATAVEQAAQAAKSSGVQQATITAWLFAGRPFVNRHFARQPSGEVRDSGWRGWPTTGVAVAIADDDVLAFLAEVRS
jgi:hypothetical protein